MPRATICVDSGVPEQAVVEAWLCRWRNRLAFLSENEGCGCCVHMYRVEAPREALDELPPIVFASSEWSPMYGAINPVIVSAAETTLRRHAEPERFERFKNCAPRDFVDQDVGQLRALYEEGDELWIFRTTKRAGGWEGYALVRRGKVVGAAVLSRQP
jgi:hypothetical protein